MTKKSKIAADKALDEAIAAAKEVYHEALAAAKKTYDKTEIEADLIKEIEKLITKKTGLWVAKHSWWQLFREKAEYDRHGIKEKQETAFLYYPSSKDETTILQQERQKIVEILSEDFVEPFINLNVLPECQENAWFIWRKTRQQILEGKIT